MFNQKQFIDALKFVSSAAALKDVRYYLNGVLFEVRPNRLTLASTDGHRMAVVEIAAETGGRNGDVIVPISDVKLLLTAVKREDLPGLAVSLSGEGLTIEDRSGRNWPVKGIEGKFPDWRRVAPSGEAVATTSIGLNAKYLAEAGAACAKLSSDRYAACVVELRGASSIISISPAVHLYERAFIAIMPSRV